MSAENPPSTIVFAADTEGASAKINGLAKTIDNLAGEAKKAGSSFNEFGAGLEPAVTKTAAQLARAERDVKRTVTEIIIAQEKLGKADALDLKLKTAGFGDAYKTTIDQMRLLETGAKQTASRFNEMGLTAGQMSNSLRQVPSQLTDIVVSLQSGQKPLTVLFQQGGQLKDMFGGIGNAVKIMGGYLLTLLTPLNVAIGAVAGLAYAFTKGASESEAYNAALVKTGNFAGTTAVQLSAMAKAVAQVTGSTVGASADALAQLAATGTIASSQFEKLSAAAVAWEKATGTAVSETVKQFAELGKDPVKASERLNESTHFLTLAVYDQIKALTDQGRMAEAGAVAQNAWADALNNRTPQIVENLGYIEKAYKAVVSGAKAVGSAIAGVGREATFDDLARKQKEYNIEVEKGRGDTEYSKRLAAELDQIKQKLALEVRSAGEAEKNAKAVEYQTRFNGLAADSMDKKQKAQIKINELAEAYGNLTNKNEKNTAAYVASVNKILKEASDPVAKSKEGNPFQAEQDAAKSWAKYMVEFAQAANNANSEAADLTKTQSRLVEYLQSPAYQNMAEPARQLALQSAYAAIAQEQTTVAVKEATKANDRYVASLTSSANSIESQLTKMKDEVQAYTLSKDLNISLAEAIDRVAVARLQEQVAIEMSYGNDAAVQALQKEITARKELAGVIAKNEANKAAEKIENISQVYSVKLDAYGQGNAERVRQEGIANLRERFSTQPELLNKALNDWDEYIAKKAKIEESWYLGSKEALSNYMSDVSNLYQSMGELTTKTFRGMEDALVELVTKGKLDFNSLADTIVSGITRIIVQQQLIRPMADYLQGGLSNNTGLGGFITSGLNSIFGTGDFASGMADPFAKIISGGSMRASGGPVSAGAMYQVNERGPELLNVSGKQYLMMGTDSGTVTPNDKIGGKSIVFNLHQNFAQGTSRQTTMQAAADASRQLQYAGRNL